MKLRSSSLADAVAFSSADLEEKGLRTVVEEIRRTHPGFWAPSWFVRDLPHASEFWACLVDLSAWLISLDSARRRTVIVLCFTTAGSPYVTTTDAEFDGELLSADVLVLDLRAIYEALAISLASPLSQETGDFTSAVSFAQLALATRLNSRSRPSLNRLILGLTASGRDGFRFHEAEVPCVRNFDTLERDAISKDRIRLILTAISMFMFFHEAAHILFTRDSALREGYEDLFEKIAVAAGANLAHLHEHEAKAREMADEYLTERIGVYPVDQSTETLGDSRRASRSLFASVDREEMLCDAYGYSETIRVLGESEPPTAVSLAVLGQALCLGSLLLPLLTTPASVCDRCVEFVDLFDGKESAKDIERATRELEFEKAIQKSQTLQAARNHCAQQAINVACYLHHQEVSETIGSDERAQRFLERFNEFWVQFQQGILSLCLSYRGLIALSSRGRGLELFLQRAEVALRRDADPFCLYVFGNCATEQGSESDNPNDHCAA